MTPNTKKCCGDGASGGDRVKIVEKADRCGSSAPLGERHLDNFGVRFRDIGAQGVGRSHLVARTMKLNTMTALIRPD